MNTARPGQPPPSQSKTPGSIVVREFDAAALATAPEYFFDGDAFKTQFLNGLSVLFPEGERFFIRSVLAYRSQVTDPKLLQEIKAFSAQEAQHTLVHAALNDLAARHGYPVARLEAINKKLLRRFSRRGRRFAFARRAALATTVCLEHFTAILAFQVLTGADRQLKGLDPAVRALFEWHALEEIEHKAVAFDVYQATGGGPVFLRLAMLWSSLFFLLGTLAATAVLLRKNGNLGKWSTWKSGARYLFGPRDGFLVRPFGDWLAFFLPGFHPWRQHRELNTQANLDAIGAYVS